LRIKRNKKEAAKSEELRNIATTKRLTQVAATERKQDGDRKEGHLKDTMRRLAGDVSTRKELGTDAKNLASASKAASELKKTKNISKTKAAPMMKQPSKGVKQKKSCVAQGLRKVPKASDEHGCQHSGVRDLIVLHKNYLAMYVKVNGWLHQKPCKGCAEKKNEVGDRDRVMDVSTLLSLKGNNSGVGFVCNCGPIGHGMKEDNAAKKDYTCDMVLCMSCYASRLDKADSSAGNKRTRRKRKI
jgi:hypothetical protein